MKVLYFDCFSGASGDMIVGALVDAGVPLEEIRAALGSLSIDSDAVWTERVQRAGIGGGSARCYSSRPLVRMTMEYHLAESFGVRLCVRKSTWTRPKRWR